MNKTDEKGWRQISWNGVSFSAPIEWQITRIEPSYLLLEDTEGPIFELKWGSVKGKFSLQQQLRRLQAKLPRKRDYKVSGCPIPVEWEGALTAYQVACFNWKGPSLSGGKGLVLHCKACGTATLMQFLRIGTERLNQGASQLACRLLKSFSDHRESQDRLWAIYDIQAAIPNGLGLTTHRFDAGDFELRFEDKQKTVTLYRWSLASMRLAESDLEHFAESRLPCIQGMKSTESLTTRDASCQWDRFPADGFDRLKCRLKSKAPFERIRLWHLDGADRILGVRAEARTPIDETDFGAICDRFKVV